MDNQISGLLDVIDQRERSTRLVLGARASDERHRILATRYLLSLDAFRTLLDEYAEEDDPEELLEVQAVAAALGLDLTVPAN